MISTTTIAANLKHAARNQEIIKIGGGKFNSEELMAAAKMLELAEDMHAVLKLVANTSDLQWATDGNGIHSEVSRVLKKIESA